MLTTQDGTVTYDRRLRDLEAAAFRATRTLAEHSAQLATTRGQQHTALANAIVAPEEHTIAERLDTIEQRLDTIQSVLLALTRPQGIDPQTAG